MLGFETRDARRETRLNLNPITSRVPNPASRTRSPRTMSSTRELAFSPIDNARLSNLVGPMDENLHQVEQRLGVRVFRRGGELVISGDDAAVAKAEQVIRQLFELSADEALTPDRVHLCLQ